MEPGESHLREKLADRSPELVELSLRARAVLREEAPEANELLYDTHAVSLVFVPTLKLKHAFAHLAVYAKKANLGFNHGVMLPDPSGMLQGKGASIRHVPLTSAALLDSPDVRALIRAAIAHSECLAEGAPRPPKRQFVLK